MPAPALTRRDLLAWMLATPLAAALPARAVSAPDGLRLLVHGKLPEAAAQGLQFGVAEASVTSTLMRRELQLGTSAAGITGAIGVISVEPPSPGAVPSATPIVLLRDVPGFPDPGCTFRAGLTETERTAALERWRLESPAAGKAADPRVVAWHPSLFRYGAAELNDRYRKQTGGPMTSEAWLAWFAVKALVDSALRAPDAPRCQALAGTRFDGHKGRPLVFDPTTRVLRQPLYIVSGDEVLGELLWEAGNR
ncbi:MAG: hypothetical protein H0T05_04445 [Acidobacteria bacterium]|nr:hypothetical protein [Acidobacteriota bacterium]MBA3885765.1 hypothetical protein [Acidobacteriota bacterium]